MRLTLVIISKYIRTTYANYRYIYHRHYATVLSHKLTHRYKINTEDENGRKEKIVGDRPIALPPYRPCTRRCDQLRLYWKMKIHRNVYTEFMFEHFNK